MTNLPLIVFDLDGTLFRSETIEITAISRALAENGYPSKTPDEILGVIGLIMKEACEYLIGECEGLRAEKFCSDVLRFEDEEIKLSGILYDGVLEFLDRMKSRGYKLCICTNGNVEYVDAIAEKFRLNRYFEEIWHQRDGITKSEAVGILKERFKAEMLIMVGDRTADIEAARDNGGISIGVSYGFGKDEVLQANYIAGSIEEVEKAVLEISKANEKT